MFLNSKIYSFNKIDISTFFISLIVFFKFFILQEQIPLHDEVTAIERFTEIQNFLRKDGVNNHTLVSIYGTLIRSLFGFDLILFRLISLLSFVGILFIFNRIFKNYFFLLSFLLIIYNSNSLFNSINTFRGYYIYSFISCALFYLLLRFKMNRNNFKEMNYIFTCLFLITINALYGIYICLPILCTLFIYKFKQISFYINSFIYFFIPVLFFYLIFFFLDGLIMNHNSNLNINFITNNFNLIFIDNIKTGFINVFNATPEIIRNNEFKSYFYTFKRFLYGEDPVYSKEYLFIIIYLISISLIIINYFKGFDLFDIVISLIFIFFLLIDKDPFIRVHAGTIYFCIFYIFYNFKFRINFFNKFEFNNIINSFILFGIIVLTISQSPNTKWQQTKPSIEKINKVLLINSCIKANDILSQYEIWITKNIYPDKCQTKYDYVKKINTLF
tara:strand:- start:162 stop:1493 length:1332 start_codon:yes stop_codon:yes gene_type:complete